MLDIRSGGSQNQKFKVSMTSKSELCSGDMKGQNSKPYGDDLMKKVGTEIGIMNKRFNKDFLVLFNCEWVMIEIIKELNIWRHR